MKAIIYKFKIFAEISRDFFYTLDNVLKYVYTKDFAL